MCYRADASHRELVIEGERRRLGWTEGKTAETWRNLRGRGEGGERERERERAQPCWNVVLNLFTLCQLVTIWLPTHCTPHHTLKTTGQRLHMFKLQECPSPHFTEAISREAS